MAERDRAGTAVYRGMTDHVTPPDEAERIRRTLYRTDAASCARVLPTYEERLSPLDLDRFAADGYLAMEGVLTPDDIAAAAAALSDIAHGRTPHDGSLFVQAEPLVQQGGLEAPPDDPERRIRKVAAFCAADARLGRLAAHPRLVPILDQLLGPGARMIQDMALLKPPFLGSEKPWHQDAAYFNWAPLDGVLGVWLALDSATVDNGCMQVIPEATWPVRCPITTPGTARSRTGGLRSGARRWCRSLPGARSSSPRSSITGRLRTTRRTGAAPFNSTTRRRPAGK